MNKTTRLDHMVHCEQNGALCFCRCHKSISKTEVVPIKCTLSEESQLYNLYNEKN